MALVYYAALQDRLFAWALFRGGSEFVERDLSATELRGLVARHRAALEQESSEAARSTGAILYDELVRPLQAALTSRRVLIVIPDRTLQSLAFASLVDRQTGRYLVEDHLLGVAPSGSVFVRASAVASSSPRQERALIVGNPRFDRPAQVGLPDLPGAEAEAAEVAALLHGAKLLTGSRATKTAFLAGVHVSDVVHYAGHAVSGADGTRRGSCWLPTAPREIQGCSSFASSCRRRSQGRGSWSWPVAVRPRARSRPRRAP